MYQERLRGFIPCTECGVELTVVSMTAHRQHMHGMEPEINWNWLPVSQTERIQKVFDVSFPEGLYQLGLGIHQVTNRFTCIQRG